MLAALELPVAAPPPAATAPPAAEFPRRVPAPATREEFLALLERNEPIIFTNLAAQWRALAEWDSPDALAQITGSARGDVAVRRFLLSKICR